MTAPHPWLSEWGEAIGPDGLSGPFAVRFRDFLAREAEGIATLTGARRNAAGGAELLLLDVATNRPQRPVHAIGHTEPIAILLTDDARYAPVVLSQRPDFPDTPHQNWVPDGVPFALCIDDRPWQDARSLYTPAELLQRIMRWFERAGRGDMHDPRQPLDPFFLREGTHVVIPRDAFSAGTGRELIGISASARPAVITLREPKENERHGAATFVVLTFAIEPRAMRRMRRAPSNLASLVDELQSRGIDLARELSERILAWSQDEGRSRFGSRLCVLLRMPILGPDGVSTDASDDVAFLSTATVGEIGVALGTLGAVRQRGGITYAPLILAAQKNAAALAAIAVVPASAHLPFDQQRAVQLAGRASTPPGRIAQVGAGAIGSLVAEALAREGFGREWALIDGDDLLPHNLERHDLTIDDIGASKAPALARRIARLRTDVAAHGIVADVLNPEEEKEAVDGALRDAELVIDAAASVPVSRHLSDLPGKARRVSVFFNPAGTAAVMLMESADRATDLRALEARYYGELLGVPELHEHLAQSAEALPYAGACRAVTNRIPASRAQILAGLAAQGIAAAVESSEACLRIWTIEPDGAVRVHRPKLQDARSASSIGWTVVLPQDVEAKILSMRAAGLPSETGGVLFGVVDMTTSRIDVVEAWPAPPDSSGSQTEFVRGTQGLSQGVRTAIARTLDQVRYIGEWHSHPRRARTAPSATDIGQLGWLAATLSMDGCPGVMLIAGDRGVNICIGAVIEGSPESSAA